jgi:methionyl-tRNA formyltransferase
VPGHGQPGQRLAAGPGQLVVACGEDALALLEVQLPGGRRMPGRDLLQRLAPLPG